MELNRRPWQRRSPIWNLSDAEFRMLVAKSKTKTEVLAAFGMENKGGNCNALNLRIKELELDISHFEAKHIAANRLLALDVNDVFVDDATCSRNVVKKHFRKLPEVPYICSLCGIGDVWMGKELVLRLDHIDGKSRNNTKGNLRWVCPNCDSQLETFCGRNKKNCGID